MNPGRPSPKSVQETAVADPFRGKVHTHLTCVKVAALRIVLIWVTMGP